MSFCLQERYAPGSICFGCGPANAAGLHLRTIAGENECTAEWTPGPEHQAFPGVLNGGIIGALLDCQCNWTAAWRLMRERGADAPDCTVTARYEITLQRPTPADAPVRLRSWVTEVAGNRATVEGELTSGGQVCATCRGTFVAVKPGHPAYHRWG